MQPPEFIQEVGTGWQYTGTTTRTTGSFNVQAGDVLVVYAVAEGHIHDISISNNGVALTWTLQEDIQENEFCRTYIWTTVMGADRTGLTVTFTYFNSANVFGGSVLTFRGSDGIGASAQNNDNAGVLEDVDLNLTTTQENSAVVIIAADWEASSGASRNWKTNAGAFTELAYRHETSRYTVYGGYHADTGAAATREYGLTAPLNMRYSIAAVEVLGTASAFPTTPVQDNFNRTGSLYGSTASGGGSWGPSPTSLSNNNLSIVSNQLTGDSGAATFSSAYMNHAMYGPDTETYVTIATKGVITNSEIVALFARLQNPHLSSMSCYYMEIRGNANIVLVRLNPNGDQVSLLGGSQSFDSGDSFGFTVTGTTNPVLTGWYKPADGLWTDFITYTDMFSNNPPASQVPFLTAGYIGIETRDNTSRLDDFGGGTIGGGQVPVFPNSGVLDDFNRANNSTLGSNWSVDALGASAHAFNIVSNEATTDNGWYCEQWWNLSAFGPDCEAYMTVVEPPVGHVDCAFGLSVRLQSPGSSAVDGYRLVIQPDAQTWEIDVLTNGVETPIGTSVTRAVAAGDKVGLLAKGDTLYAFHYTAGVWSLVLSRTDSTYQSAGSIGLWAYDPHNNAVFDDFGGGTTDSVPFVSSPNFLPFFV